MKQLIIAAAAVAALSFLKPAFAADVTQASTSYETTLTQSGVLAAPGAYTGSLQIKVGPEGLVSGWYRPYDQSFIPVTGNIKDGSVWLYVGERGDLTISAQVQKDGSLVGTAFERTPRVDVTGALRPGTYDFSANPQAASQTY